MGKVCNNIRAKWSAEQLEGALSAVRNNVSQREAAHIFGIPRRTLRNHILSGKATKALGRKSVLSWEQEKEFAARIIRYCDIGMPLTARIVRHQVFRFCQTNNIRHNFNVSKQMAGKDWFYRFLKRNPHLSRRRAQAMNPARAQKLNKAIVKDYFKKLDKILTDMKLKTNPQNLYNMDEKGCRLTIHHQQSVLAQKGAKRVHMIAPEHAQNVTIVGCCNAIGNAIPPMIIFKGKRLKPEFGDNLPAGSIVHMSPKGSMTTDLFIIFLKHLARFKGTDPILLVFDGASCHLDYDIVDAAEELDIKLFCLPSNTTHELQPLDKAVYRSYESHWDQEVLRFWDHHPDRTISKLRFNKIFSNVWPKCMTPENITSGFKATGLFPFNPDAIPESAFAPSILTQLPLAECEDEGARTTIVSSPVNSYQPVEDSDKYLDEDLIPLSVLARQLADKKKENQLHPPLEIQRRSEPETIGTSEDIVHSQSQSFTELLPTPEMKQKPNSNRRKALNYKAQAVTKDLFSSIKKKSKKDAKEKPHYNDNIGLSQPSTSGLERKRKSSQMDSENWYCPACQTEDKLDMRQCKDCNIWYHEICVGLSETDYDDFYCGECS